MSKNETTSAVNWLRLAAAPALAAMAMLTGVIGSEKAVPICMAPNGLSWLGGMVPMYLLMSAIHLAPWLTLVANWRQERHVSRRALRTNGTHPTGAWPQRPDKMTERDFLYQRRLVSFRPSVTDDDALWFEGEWNDCDENREPTTRHLPSSDQPTQGEPENQALVSPCCDRLGRAAAFFGNSNAASATT